MLSENEPTLRDLQNLPLVLDGETLTAPDVRDRCRTHRNDPGPVGELFRFLADWYDGSATLTVQTSGSTGAPKPMQVEKVRMAASARLTCQFLGLGAGDTAFLCMPLQYIAGKMVVVRALIAGLSLIPVRPSSNPLEMLASAPVFAAMTPMQAWESLKDPRTTTLLRNVQHLLLGGGSIDATLEDALRDMPGAVWSSYGMTETLSHIALRRINGPQASIWYTALDGVAVDLTTEGTLRIHAPRVCPDVLVTNDLAEMNGQRQFRILGRRDNVINSGGLKIQIEEVERLLAPHLPGQFLITAVPDARLGETVVLLLEGEVADVRDLCRRVLPKHWQPTSVVSVPALPRTETGKPARAEARALAQRLLRER